MTRPKSPIHYKTEQRNKKNIRSASKGESTSDIRNSIDSSTKDSAAIVSTSDSLSVRTSDSSKRDSIASDAILRDSRTSSGVVISEKTISTEDRREKKKRERKVYTQSRQSERIRRIRLEIDGEAPFEFLSLPYYATGKRKREAGIDDPFVDSPHIKIRKTTAQPPLPRRARRKIQR